MRGRVHIDDYSAPGTWADALTHSVNIKVLDDAGSDGSESLATPAPVNVSSSFHEGISNKGKG